MMLLWFVLVVFCQFLFLELAKFVYNFFMVKPLETQLGLAENGVDDLESGLVRSGLRVQIGFRKFGFGLFNLFVVFSMIFVLKHYFGEEALLVLFGVNVHFIFIYFLVALVSAVVIYHVKKFISFL